MSLLQSIHLATVAGQGLHFPDGSTAYLGALSGIVLVRYLSGRTEQWHNEELYDAIKARLPQVQPTQEWREKIIRLIKTATMDELTENALTNGDIHFGLFAECVYVNKPDTQTVILWSPEIVGAADARRAELLRARRRAQDDAQAEAIERILS